MNYTPDMLSSGLKMTAALVLVLAVVLLAAWVARRYLGRRTGTSGAGLRILASQYVGVKKNVMLLEVPGSVLVLGIAGERISLLDKIQDPEALKEIRREEPGSPAVSFLAHLNQFRSRSAETKK